VDRRRPPTNRFSWSFHFRLPLNATTSKKPGTAAEVQRNRNGYRFSVITKTIFENTNYPLRTWFRVVYLMTRSKKGISSLQIHRQIKSGDYRTAW